MNRFNCALLCLALVSCAHEIDAQSRLPPPVQMTAEQDHQNMMDQLGIKALRPGPSGDEKLPNHANYDRTSPIHIRICRMYSRSKAAKR